MTGRSRYDSKSEGLVENAHQSNEKRYQTKLSPSSPLVQWGVRRSSWSLTRYTILANGLTFDTELRGREYGGAIAELGETVLYHVQGLIQKFARRWDGQDVADRRAHLGNAVRQAAGAQ